MGPRPLTQQFILKTLNKYLPMTHHPAGMAVFSPFSLILWPFKGRGTRTLERRAHVFREKQETQDELGNIFLLVGLMAQYVHGGICCLLDFD